MSREIEIDRRGNEKKQTRYTLEDVKKSQADLRSYLEGKLTHSEVMSVDRKILPDLMTDALLSQPWASRYVPTTTLDDKVVTMGANVFELLTTVLKPDIPIWKNRKGIHFYLFNFNYDEHFMSLPAIWRLILTITNRLSAGAQAEAISRSKEREESHGMTEVRND